MSIYTILHAVESSSEDDWTVVEVDETPDGHTSLAIFNEDPAVSLAWGRKYRNGESWTEPWSKSVGFPNSDIRGYYLDVRYNGVPISRDLVLSVDGGRGYLPSGMPITEVDKGIVGMEVSEPEMKRARLLDAIAYEGHSEFNRYAERANIKLKQPEDGGPSRQSRDW